jgi:hypothetical protein
MFVAVDLALVDEEYDVLASVRCSICDPSKLVTEVSIKDSFYFVLR